VRLIWVSSAGRISRPFQRYGFRNRASASAAPHTDKIVPTPVTTIHSFARSMEVRRDPMEVLTDPNSVATSATEAALEIQAQRKA
jgi:hypothetical protein